MPVRRIKLLIEYDGSGFHGWQVQNNAYTIQEEMERAIFKITGEEVRIAGAGRTDAGVHAYGQVAHFDTQSRIPAEKFTEALNAVLPEGVAVLSSEETGFDFHARFSAIGKTYEYKVLNRHSRSPIQANRAWHIREELNLERLREAAAIFIGSHDFSAFCASRHSIRTFDRMVYSSDWISEGECLIFRVWGNGFLYNMVRIMTGTMVEVGLGKRKPESIRDLFEEKNRCFAGITAPPQGLYLVKVHYEPPADDKGEKVEITR